MSPWVARAAAAVALVLIAESAWGQPGFADVARARAQLETTVRRCFKSGWGWASAYNSMTRKEVYAKLDELIARHAERQQRFRACDAEARQHLGEYRKGVERFKAEFTPSVKDAAKAQTLTAALQVSVDSLDAMVNTVFPKVIDLEGRYVEFFKALRREPPSAAAFHLEPKSSQQLLEHQITSGLRRQASSAAAYLEAMYLLSPSPPLRTRAAIARILDVIYRGAENMASPEERPMAARFAEYREALDRAHQLVSAEIGAGESRLGVPAATPAYRDIRGQIEDAQKALRDLGATGPAVSRAKHERLVATVERSLERIDTLAQRIDAEARRCFSENC